MSRRILILEDNPVISRSLARLIPETNYVYQAFTCQDAIDKYDESEFDLVMVDLRLPDMPGEIFIEHVKHAKRGTTIICMTGSPERLDTDLFQGVTCMVKPFSPEQIAFFRTLV